MAVTRKGGVVAEAGVDGPDDALAENEAGDGIGGGNRVHGLNGSGDEDADDRD
jgi:hypothetical protein